MKTTFKILALLITLVSFGQAKRVDGVQTFTSAPVFQSVANNNANVKILSLSPTGVLQFVDAPVLSGDPQNLDEVLAVGNTSTANINLNNGGSSALFSASGVSANNGNNTSALNTVGVYSAQLVGNKTAGFNFNDGLFVHSSTNTDGTGYIRSSYLDQDIIFELPNGAGGNLATEQYVNEQIASAVPPTPTIQQVLTAGNTVVNKHLVFNDPTASGTAVDISAMSGESDPKIKISRETVYSEYGYNKVKGESGLGNWDLSFVNAGTGVVATQEYVNDVVTDAIGGLDPATLQSVTDNGNNTTNAIFVKDDLSLATTIATHYNYAFNVQDQNTGKGASINNLGELSLSSAFDRFGTLTRNPAQSTASVNHVLPATSGTLALLTDIPAATTPTLQQVTTAGSTTTTNIQAAKFISGSGTNGGFENASYTVNSHQNIWRIGSSPEYGLGFYQGTALDGSGLDGIGFHFGNRSTPQFKVRADGNLNTIGEITAIKGFYSTWVNGHLNLGTNYGSDNVRTFDYYSEGDNVDFPNSSNVTIRANVEEFIHLKAVNDDGGFDFSVSPYGVQIGDLQVATEDAVNYHTTETKTGGKWINGKPIYRIVYSVSTTSTGFDFPFPSTAENVVSCKFTAKHNNNLTVSDVSSLRADVWGDCGINTTVIYIENVNNYEVIDGAIILEYTKTTD